LSVWVRSKRQRGSFSQRVRRQLRTMILMTMCRFKCAFLSDNLHALSVIMHE
jgi:hypothetical protein